MAMSRVYTVAFQGIEAREVDVQVRIARSSQPSFTIVGLADKAVGESRERVYAALSAIGLYSLNSYSLSPVTTEQRVAICRPGEAGCAGRRRSSAVKRDSVAVAPRAMVSRREAWSQAIVDSAP